VLLVATCAGLEFGPRWQLFEGAVSPGGVAGFFVSRYLTSVLNVTGAIALVLTCWVLSLYLVSSFSMRALSDRVTSALRSLLPSFEWRRRRAATPPVQQERVKVEDEYPAPIRLPREPVRRTATAFPPEPDRPATIGATRVRDTHLARWRISSGPRPPGGTRARASTPSHVRTALRRLSSPPTSCPPPAC
jgi:hypothetical protein